MRRIQEINIVYIVRKKKDTVNDREWGQRTTTDSLWIVFSFFFLLRKVDKVQLDFHKCQEQSIQSIEEEAAMLYHWPRYKRKNEKNIFYIVNGVTLSTHIRTPQNVTFTHFSHSKLLLFDAIKRQKYKKKNKKRKESEKWCDICDHINLRLWFKQLNLRGF